MRSKVTISFITGEVRTFNQSVVEYQPGFVVIIDEMGNELAIPSSSILGLTVTSKPKE